MIHSLALKTPRMALPIVVACLGLLFAWFLSHADAATPFMRQMEFGSRGDDVMRLQTFLTTSNFIYPEGIISGYYGPLTQKAVLQFQTTYGLPQTGRVGPLTLAKLNALIANRVTLDISAPLIGAITLQPTRNGATIIWVTTEDAQGTVYYDVSPLFLSEAQSMDDTPYVSGATATNGNFLAMQSVTIAGLQPNTTYHYAIRSMDTSRNMTFTWPATFRTQE